MSRPIVASYNPKLPTWKLPPAPPDPDPPHVHQGEQGTQHVSESVERCLLCGQTDCDHDVEPGELPCGWGQWALGLVLAFSGRIA